MVNKHVHHTGFTIGGLCAVTHTVAGGKKRLEGASNHSHEVYKESTLCLNSCRKKRDDWTPDQCGRMSHMKDNISTRDTSYRVETIILTVIPNNRPGAGINNLDTTGTYIGHV